MKTEFALVLLTLFAHTGSSGKSANDKRKPIENYKLSSWELGIYTDPEPHHEKLKRTCPFVARFSFVVHRQTRTWWVDEWSWSCRWVERSICSATTLSAVRSRVVSPWLLLFVKRKWDWNVSQVVASAFNLPYVHFPLQSWNFLRQTILPSFIDHEIFPELWYDEFEKINSHLQKQKPHTNERIKTCNHPIPLGFWYIRCHLQIK